MNLFIFFAAIIIIICISLGKISFKYGIPTLLAFIVLGMLFGSDGILKIGFDNYSFAEQICSIALIFIMFYGGFGTNMKKAKPVALKSVLLSSLGVILTAFFTGLFCYFVLKIPILESFLIGSVIGSTDAASVFAILRSKKLNLKYNTASLLEVESGSNDPFAYMLTVIVLSLMKGEFSAGQMIYMIFAQIIFGALFGVITAVAALFVLKRAKFTASGSDSLFVFSIALVSYSGAALIGGNGYLSTYITGIILGNKPIKNKKTMVGFFDGLNGLMQIAIFFLLGLLSFPSQLPKVALPALAIALFLTFIARPLAVFAILTPFKCPFNQQLLVSLAGLRGAASIVFAIMAQVSAAHIGNDIFHIVFFIVLFSISLQGTLIPIAAKKLGMTDDSSDVMKTFSDYSEEVPVEFIKLQINLAHPWANHKIKDIKLLPQTLIVLLVRGSEHIVPKGNTVILPNDIAVISAPSIEGEYLGSLTEIRIDHDSEWLGKALSEIKFDSDMLVVMIKRKNSIIIPEGKTKLRENDVMIINHSQ